MQRAIKENLLEKPHLEEFKVLAQKTLDNIAAFGSHAALNVKSLRELEKHLKTTAFVSDLIRNNSRVPFY
jgi:hypothetical protein